MAFAPPPQGRYSACVWGCKQGRWFFQSVAILIPFAASAQIPGDSTNGKLLFEREGCVNCHGGDPAAPPDRFPARARFSRADLAGAMWRHAPWVRKASTQQGALLSELSPSEADDLFSYIYVEVTFRLSGNARRGEKLVKSRRCAGCHFTGGDLQQIDPAVAWDPVRLARGLWNHSTRADPELQRWPKFSPVKVRDLVAYLRTKPGGDAEPHYRVLSAGEGHKLFESKGCADCHDYPPAHRYPVRTTSDFAAAMGNHTSSGKLLPLLSVEDMRKLTGYLWSIYYFDQRGDAEHGRRLFRRKHCDACHAAPRRDAPPLNEGEKVLSSSWMISALCRRGPVMVERVKNSGIGWPRFQGEQMADLLAYLNSLKRLHTRGAVQ